ncbi:unnamed protein product [Durusdinium trenchii]|uniref:Uncharacterized protein n=1 Tax=Durusdinium trenchii TaxID=1381693 RepID=A0ABP0PUJ4_9DINO
MLLCSIAVRIKLSPFSHEQRTRPQLPCKLPHGCGLAGLAAAALGGLAIGQSSVDMARKNSVKECIRGFKLYSSSVLTLCCIEVTLTDRDETLFLLERNARNFAAEHCQDHRPRRSGKMSAAVGTEATCCSPPCARHLDWSEPLELDHPETPFQVILAADCLYSLEGAAALAAVVNALCCEPESAAFGAKVLLSQELRAPEVLESFLEKVIRAFRVSRLPSPPTLEQAAPCVMLYRLQPRCTH